MSSLLVMLLFLNPSTAVPIVGLLVLNQTVMEIKQPAIAPDFYYKKPLKNSIDTLDK